MAAVGRGIRVGSKRLQVPATDLALAVSHSRDRHASTMKTDLDLAHAIVRGSEAACTEFVNRYRNLCFHAVRPFVTSDDEAFDLCQDTFVRALDRMGQYRGEGSLAAWLGRIALNIAKRRAEQIGARREVSWEADERSLETTLASPEPGIDVVLDARDDQRRLQQALRTLTVNEQTVLRLYHFEELSLAEISALTGQPVGTLKSHLSRGRQRLRRALDTDDDPPLITGKPR